MIFARGDLEIRDAFAVDQRMGVHGAGTFYSDHAAVVADIAQP